MPGWGPASLPTSHTHLHVDPQILSAGTPSSAPYSNFYTVNTEMNELNMLSVTLSFSLSRDNHYSISEGKMTRTEVPRVGQGAMKTQTLRAQLCLCTWGSWSWPLGSLS